MFLFLIGQARKFEPQKVYEIFETGDIHPETDIFENGQSKVLLKLSKKRASFAVVERRRKKCCCNEEQETHKFAF